jgi:branched-chain amino acid transport system permease protein
VLAYLLVSGLTTGSLYALVAMGLVVVYKATGVVNFAHGELFMLGGFLAYTLHVLARVPYVPALVLAIVATLLLGVVTERLAYRPLMRAPTVSLVLAAVGFSYVLKGAAREIWGGRGDYIPFPPLVRADPIVLGTGFGPLADVVLVPQQLVVLTGALVAMLAFAAFFNLTRAGKVLQATAENAKAAALVGIPVARVYAFTWGLGAAVAGAAAALMAPLTLIYPDVGAVLLVKAFAAAVLGGLGSLPGAALGGLTMGVIEQVAGGYVHTSLQDVSAFLVIMLVLIIRPTGLLGARGVRRA